MADTNIDHADLEFAQGRFTDPEDDRRYQQWLDRVQEEEECLRKMALQNQHELDEYF